MKITQKDNGKYKTRVYIGQTIDGKKHWIFAEREKYFVELDGGSGNGSVPEIRTLGKRSKDTTMTAKTCCRRLPRGDRLYVPLSDLSQKTRL